MVVKVPEKKKKPSQEEINALADSLANKEYDTPPREIKENEEEPTKPLQFVLPQSFHREFKMYAASRDMSMVDLFKESFKFYREYKGSQNR